MQFALNTGKFGSHKAECIILPLFESKTISINHFTAEANKYIKAILKHESFNAKLEQTLLIHYPKNEKFNKILLVGLGPKNKFAEQQFRNSVNSIIKVLATIATTSCAYFIDQSLIKTKDINWHIAQTILLINHKLYKFDNYKTDKSAKIKLKQMLLIVNDKKTINSKTKNTIQHFNNLSLGINFTRDLANTPANICTPDYLAKSAKKLATQHKKLTCKILDPKAMKKLGMQALLSVSQGSPNEPRLITLNYQGATKAVKPIIFVGKGITFDTGGNSLKPAASMIGMKYDMCGAATVFGLIEFAARSKLPLNIIGIIPAAENTPGGKASRPDDIITSMAGITVEILNTDAEGRLVLCDALAYCKQFKPQAVIDIATLTGACIIALGRHYSALYTNNEKLQSELVAASNYSFDRCWPMPLGPEYTKQLASNFADLANIGGPEAGSITAASFLAEFTKDYPWAHLDVAGTACQFVGNSKGATGQPVGLLAQYLLSKV